jgi:transposase
MISLDLTPLETWKLRELSRTAVGRVALRALMVLWRAEGLTTLEIAQRLGVHRDTVSLWLERYVAAGIDGLHDEHHPGRPPAIPPPVREQLEVLLEGAPDEPERPRSFWTLAHLRTVLQPLASRRFGIATLRRVVHQLDFRWRRPRLWAHKEDPATFEKLLLIEAAKRAAAQQAETIAAEPSRAPVGPPRHFLYADASDHHLLAVIRSMWMRRGRQTRVATPPSNGHTTLFGALNVQTGVFSWQPYGKALSAHFLAFLSYLLKEAYPEGDVLLVVDNASYHRSRAVVEWLKEHPRLLLLFLPTRRPDLNPVEHIWGELKDAVSANRSFGSLDVLQEFIRRHFAARSPADFLAQAGLRNEF